MNDDHGYMYHLLDTAKKIKDEGDNLDIVLTIMGNGTPALMNLNPWWGEDYNHKTVMEAIGGMLGFGLDAHTIYIVSEAWMSKLPAEGMTKEEAMAEVDKAEFVRPSKDPNRIEAIMVHEIRKDGKQYCMLTPFERRLMGIQYGESNMMEDHVDYTFHHFFIGLKKAEQTIAAVLKLTGRKPDDVFDTGKTALEHARAGAIKAAKAQFHIELEEVHDGSSN
jgi:hypothetical protein